MNPTPLVIFGASGLAREFHDVVEAINAWAVESGRGPVYEFLGFIDRDQSLAASVADRGAIIGDDSAALALPRDTQYVVAIADPHIRQRIDVKMSEVGFEAARIIHPLASVGPRGNIFDPGVVICANASITTAVTLGRHVHVQLNVTVGHDVVAEDYVSLMPSCSISGNVVISESTTIGTGARLLQGLSIGANSFVGAGAVITRPVPENVTVFPRALLQLDQIARNPRLD